MDKNFSYPSMSQNYAVEQHRKDILKVAVVISDRDTSHAQSWAHHVMHLNFQLISYHYLMPMLHSEAYAPLPVVEDV